MRRVAECRESLETPLGLTLILNCPQRSLHLRAWHPYKNHPLLILLSRLT
ncbi:casein kinase II [Histoplasma capsulatum G186AR]|uniref:Casein kinase II n=1 Tax=Ajellomyces capsulatus TaxID=5037 RepID=A0A8H7YYS3_AJECA|nr:casein kinase II [Histoplasma capsulatum]QSS67698.1 casein kinase II [Histoplasma capsulatum G186AR]